MKNFVLIIYFLYLSVFPKISNKVLNSNHSFVDNFSFYLNNLFEKNYLEAKVRKVRSNSDESLKWKGFETKQSFSEIPVFRLEFQNKTLLSSQTVRSDDSHDFPIWDNLFIPDANINRLKTSAEELFAITRNTLSNKSDKLYVLQKIIDEFKRNNLITSTQQFITTAEESNGKILEGFNIIGIYPGIYRNGDTSKDRILLIGAHYDTVDKTNGVNDNGSGMTVLLEIIRLINIYNCRLTYSLIFVALDLEEYGALGSKYFVNQYLIPNELISKKCDFEGAIILDTVLNFNQTFGSQDIPYDVHKALPEWSQQIRKNRFVGDFLGLISRNNIDDKLNDQIRNSWKSLSERTPYRLSELKINSLDSRIPDFNTLSKHANLLRSDHIMFWYHKNSQYNQTLNAVLLTDTGPFRGYMRECYHISCDDIKHLNEKNLRFLKLTTDVLTQTAVKLTLGKCTNI